MTTVMFHVKHWPSAGKRGSDRGQDGSRGGLGGASGGLNAAVLKAAGLAFGAAMLAACSSPEDVADKTGVGKATATATASDGASATAAAAAQAAGAVAFTDNSSKDEASREFAYSWPAQVSSVPELVGRFTAERDTLLSEQKTEWDEAIREFAGQDCVACVNRGFEKSWQVVADLPRFLSLSADIYFYTGGAHGNSGHDALVWDREAKAAFDPKAMFTSSAALQSALGDPWCKALKTERMKRMGDDYSDDGFFQCPSIADLTMLPGSSNRQTFNRIGLLAAPYVAGSYAEGTYEVTLPVTPALLGAVKPEYKSAFALAK